MRIELLPLAMEKRKPVVHAALHNGERLGLITSIDGNQLLTVLVSTLTGAVRCFETPLVEKHYPSLTPTIPQAHWFERTVWDMFGLLPEGHPRLKRTHLHEPYTNVPPPLSSRAGRELENHAYQFLKVEGDGLYEIPVGPIHAGIIEPAHFRFSCFGEVIVNLEVQLGYVHRGVEKNLAESHWRKTGFIAEAAASDMPVANAVANAIAIESLFGASVSRRSALLRGVALEVERLGMHLSDLGGLAGDVGYLAIASSLGRLRARPLRIADLLSGNRFMRGFIRPGGVSRDLPESLLLEIHATVRELRSELAPVLSFYLDNQVAIDRMEGVGKVSPSLARDFGLVGVAGRASGNDYDCRLWNADFAGLRHEFTVAHDGAGDVLARAKIRIMEVGTSLNIVEDFLSNLVPGKHRTDLPDTLPASSCAIGIVESHRGELIHLLITDESGGIKRYCIKDPSVNNWTGLAIAVRNNYVADFPLCNKSFSLSYGGHDL